jgi:hypothetical protein
LREKIYERTVLILRSAKFFYVTIAVFVIESSWIALSGLYSMSYDENTHLGLIRLYSHKWLPFWSSTPAGPAPYGAVSRDPSYMYHYLMSFPYRLLEQVVHTETYQVLILRFTSIGLFVVGIFIYRRLLLRTNASKPLVHVLLAVFVLTPVVPLLAAQINYDNLVFPLTALSVLMTIRITESIRRDEINLKSVMLLIGLGMFTSLVKYAYLPIFAAILIWLVLITRRQFHGRGHDMSTKVRKSFTTMSRLSKILLVGLLLIMVALFVERYGVNLVKYREPIPECDQVISIKQCSAYGPWQRNYLTYQDKVKGLLPVVSTNPLSYLFKTWLGTMSYQLFFTLAGISTGFIVGDPLLLPRSLSVVLAVVGGLLLLRWQKQLRKKFKLNLLVFVTLLYVSALWIQEYSDFRHIGLAVAIQARYLVPVLPIIYLVCALAFARALMLRPYLKAVLAVLIISVFLLEGGGAMTFIIRSDSTWYWNNSFILRANHNAQGFFKKFVIDT